MEMYRKTAMQRSEAMEFIPEDAILSFRDVPRIEYLLSRADNETRREISQCTGKASTSDEGFLLD